MTDTSPTLDATAVRPLRRHPGRRVRRHDRRRLRARLLTDLGADVVVVEPPGGSDLRHRGPYVDAAPEPASSAAGAYYLAGTRSIVVADGDRDELARLFDDGRHRRADRHRPADR